MRRKKKEVGSKVIDKTYPHPVGRIRKRTGLVTTDQLDRLKFCLQELWSQGRTEELILYKEGKIDTSRVVRLVELRETIDPNEEFLNSSLFPTLNVWIDERYHHPSTRKTNQSWSKGLRKHTDGDPLVRDIPKVLKNYKKSCRDRNVRKPFTGIRIQLGTFINENTTEGRSSDLYREWSKVKKWSPLERTTIGRKNSHNPFNSPSQLDRYFTQLNVPEEVREWIFFLCVTGVHRSEIEVGLQVEDFPSHHLRVFGTKTINRYDRLIPLVQEVPKTKWSNERVRNWLRKMDGRSPYDCRRTFSVWCLRSGIPQNHISTYMGHSVGESQTTQYQREDVRNWIRDDTILLKEWLGREISDPFVGSHPVLPVTSYEQLGKTRQHDTLEQIRKELDKVLEDWFRTGPMRKHYRINREVRSLVEVKED